MTLENATLANISFSDTKITLKKGTAAEWAAANPVLAVGEPAFETDTGIMKIGDGVTAYNSLDYVGTESFSGSEIDTLLTTVNSSNLSATHKITRSATIVIAASDSSAKSKAQADYVCNGVDDQIQIDEAISALPEMKGCISFKEGTYTCQGLPIISGVFYQGQGSGSTILNLPVGATAHLFETKDSSTIKGGCVRDLELNGGGTPTQNAIDFSTSQELAEYYIENCYIHGFNHGYHGSLDDRFCPIVNNRIWNNNVGIYVVNNHPNVGINYITNNVVGLGGNPYDMQFTATRFTYNQTGVTGLDGGSVQYCRFTNCSFSSAKTGTPIGIELGAHNHIDSCLFIGRDLSDIGILLAGAHNIITGSTFRSDAPIKRYGVAAIYFKDGADCGKNMITNCNFGLSAGDIIMAGSGNGFRDEISIRGNMITAGRHIINFPNMSSSYPTLYANVSDNTIIFNGNIGTDPLINLPNTGGTGGAIVTNNIIFVESDSCVCGPGIYIDAGASIITQNRIRRSTGIVTIGDDEYTIIENNIHIA